MESSLSAIPAGCGVVMYYFIRFLRSQSTILVNPDLEMTDKLQIMADGLVQNWGMWIAVVAFVAVILLVHLIPALLIMHGGYLLLQAVLPMCL